jgi:hypothetical protein
MKTTTTAIFFAKELPSGFYAIYVNGAETWIDAAQGSVKAVREYVDKVCRISKISSYTLVFSKAEYDYTLNYYRNLDTYKLA